MANQMTCSGGLPIIFLGTVMVMYLGWVGYKSPEDNKCAMTFMYPNYVDISMKSSPGINATYSWGDNNYRQIGEHIKGQPSASGGRQPKYRLLLYYEGWREENPADVIARLKGAPVLFIPGSGGSARQVRSLAAVSERSFRAGLVDGSYYMDSFLTPEEKAPIWKPDLSASAGAWAGNASRAEARGADEELILDTGLNGKGFPNQLDWFTIDTGGELSALETTILLEQANFVVDAVHRVLELYREVALIRPQVGIHASTAPPPLPSGVFLVGHSMGGTIARAVAVNPRLKAGAVSTILTLSSPHLAAPVGFLPSTVTYFSNLNKEWRKGYLPRNHGHAEPPLANLVVASIAGGTMDSQIRSSLTRLDGIVPPARAVSLGTTGMPGAWIGADHQVILWCNQVATQLAKTLLMLLDVHTGQAITDPAARHLVLVRQLRSAIPQILEWVPSSTPLHMPAELAAGQAARRRTLLQKGAGRLDEAKATRGATGVSVEKSKVAATDANTGEALKGDDGVADGGLQEDATVNNWQGLGKEATSRTGTTKVADEEELVTVEEKQERVVGVGGASRAKGRGRKGASFLEEAVLLARKKVLDNQKLVQHQEEIRQHAKSGEWGMRCPPGTSWIVEPQETDMFMKSSVASVTAMDGRRRWFDIHKMRSQGKEDFVLVTNLLPCGGIRVHLWRERGSRTTVNASDQSHEAYTVEITLRMVAIPSETHPPKVEKGKAVPRPGPSGILRLGPNDTRGFRFMTISVAPKPKMKGGTLPPVMASAQFFNASLAQIKPTLSWSLSTLYRPRELLVEAMHPLMLNMSLPISFGLLPSGISLNTTACGFLYKKLDPRVFCRTRCFPPIAILWDPFAGSEVFLTSLSTPTLVASDSSPVFWGAAKARQMAGYPTSSLLLLVDPTCGYSIQFKAAPKAAVIRFLLGGHSILIVGTAFAAALYALALQVAAFQRGIPLPSFNQCLRANLALPYPGVLLVLFPVTCHLAGHMFARTTPPPVDSLLLSSVLAYLMSVSIVAFIAEASLLLLQLSVAIQYRISRRRKEGSEKLHKHRLLLVFIPPMVQRLGGELQLGGALLAAIFLVFFHPALSLAITLALATSAAHSTLYRCHLAAAAAVLKSGPDSDSLSDTEPAATGHKRGNGLALGEGGEGCKDLFEHRHGLLVLHLLVLALYIPSFIAWLQRPLVLRSPPLLADWLPCAAIIVHSFFASNAQLLVPFIPFTSASFFQALPHSLLVPMYVTAGTMCFLGGLLLVPSRALQCVALVGIATVVFTALQRASPSEWRARRSAKRHEHRS